MICSCFKVSSIIEVMNADVPSASLAAWAWTLRNEEIDLMSSQSVTLQSTVNEIP